MNSSVSKNHLNIPNTGLGRLHDILPFLPFGKTEFYKRIKSDDFIKPIKLGSRMTCYRYEDLHAWLAAQGKTAQPAANDAGV